MSCDCSEQQAQRIECDICNPQFCVCEEGDSEIFCEREFIYLQSDHDSSSIISQEGCSSISSRAGANSCIQSPDQHDDLSKTFGNTISIDNSGGNELYCFKTTGDLGAGPSKISGDVGGSCSDQYGNIKRSRTSTPIPSKRKLQDLQTCSDRLYENSRISTHQNTDTTEQSKSCGPIPEQQPDTPVSGGRHSRGSTRSSSISSGTTGSSRSSSRDSSAASTKQMVHGNDRKQTPEPSKHSKDKSTIGTGCSPSPSKKIKSIPSDTKDKEGKGKSVYYWSYYKCPQTTADDSRGGGLGGQPGINPDPKRLRGASRNPKFILADHTGDEYPHAHILIACSPGGGTRGLRRCLAFLQSTPVQIAEATANLQRVVILEKCVAYMGKYGPDSIFFYGKGWETLRQMIYETDGVAGPCHAFEKVRNEQKAKLINSNLSKRNMMDDVRDHIISTQSAPFNAKLFIDCLNYDQKLQFMTMYGQESWKKWIGSVVEAMNADYKRDQPQKMFQTWFDIHTAAGGFTPNIPEVNQWWSNLFDMNLINPIEFLTKYFAIGDNVASD